jgi:cytoskeletal protein RodZ
MKRLLTVPVLVGVGAAALAFGGIAAAAVGSSHPSKHPATVVADVSTSTDSSSTADGQSESTESTESTESDASTESTEPSKESGTANNGSFSNSDNGAQHDVEDEVGDHADDDGGADEASKSTASHSEKEHSTQSGDDHGHGKDG